MECLLDADQNPIDYADARTPDWTVARDPTCLGEVGGQLRTYTHAAWWCDAVRCIVVCVWGGADGVVWGGAWGGVGWCGWCGVGWRMGWCGVVWGTERWHHHHAGLVLEASAQALTHLLNARVTTLVAREGETSQGGAGELIAAVLFMLLRLLLAAAAAASAVAYNS